ASTVRSHSPVRARPRADPGAGRGSARRQLGRCCGSRTPRFSAGRVDGHRTGDTERDAGESQNTFAFGSVGAARGLFRHRRRVMRFVEIDLFGVYVAPISVMLVIAWIVTIVLRRVAVRLGLLRHIWHPALFASAVYMIVLSSIVLALAH